MKVEAYHNWEIERALVEKKVQSMEVAKKAGIDPSIFSYIKRGRMRPTDEEEKAIAAALGMEVRDLFIVREVLSN